VNPTMSQNQRELLDDSSTSSQGTRIGSPLEFLALLVEQRRTVLRYSVTGALLGLILAVTLPARYESSAELMPPEQSGSGLLSAAMGARGGDMSGMAMASFLGVKSSGALFIGLLQSRSAQDDLIAKFDLQARYGHKTLEDTRRRLEAVSSFAEDRKDGIITVRVQDRDRQQARLMCQEYIDVLNRLIEQDATSSARKEREFLEHRLALANDELAQSGHAFSEFASKNKAIDIPQETKATIEAAASLQGQLVAAEADLSGLRQIYAPENPRVRAAEGRSALIRNKLQAIGGASTNLNGNGDELIGPSLQQLPALGVAYADFYRKLKVQDAIYGTLTTEYELAKIQEAKDLPTVRVLDAPNLPERKISPHRGLIAVGLTFFASLFSCVWLYASTAWRALGAFDAKRILANSALSAMQRDWRRLLSALPARISLGKK